jgi:hypothetical protein
MKTAIRFGPLVLLLLLGYAYGQSSRDLSKDREAIIALEQEWLHAHDAATLDRILASDWVVAHPEPKDRQTKFDKLNVRLYGDVGIVNGSVIATDENGKELDRSMFTDVFVFRVDRWQAVNAQENQVRPLGEQKH